MFLADEEEKFDYEFYGSFNARTRRVKMHSAEWQASLGLVELLCLLDVINISGIVQFEDGTATEYDIYSRRKSGAIRRL